MVILLEKVWYNLDYLEGEMPKQLEQKPAISRMAITSLGLCLASLIVYMKVIAAPSVAVFLMATGVAFVTGVVALGMSLLARKRGGRNLLVMLSLGVSLGYVFCIGIILLSVVVYWI